MTYIYFGLKILMQVQFFVIIFMLFFHEMRETQEVTIKTNTFPKKKIGVIFWPQNEEKIFFPQYWRVTKLYVLSIAVFLL